jgi:ribosomal protein L9
MKADANLKIREEYGRIIAQKVIQALREKGVNVGRKNIPVG